MVSRDAGIGRPILWRLRNSDEESCMRAASRAVDKREELRGAVRRPSNKRHRSQVRPQLKNLPLMLHLKKAKSGKRISRADTVRCGCESQLAWRVG
jgi:hypothetical protein